MMPVHCLILEFVAISTLLLAQLGASLGQNPGKAFTYERCILFHDQAWSTPGAGGAEMNAENRGPRRKTAEAGAYKATKK